MKLRNKQAGEEVEGNFQSSVGYWQQEKPLVSYSMEQWEQVQEDQP